MTVSYDRAIALAGMRYLLNYIGEDVKREGLRDTPMRFLNAFEEQCKGYKMDPARLLKTFPADGYDGMVVVGPVEFNSLCEHHLLPFTGNAWVAYIPKGKRIVGLSKLARLVDCYANRLQVQERLTKQICDALMVHLKARGAGVLIESTHLCMCVRGVKKQNATMRTQELQGCFRNADVKAEFTQLCR